MNDLDRKLERLRLERDRYRNDLRVSIREQQLRDDALIEARAAIAEKDRYIASLEATVETLRTDARVKEAYIASLLEARPEGPGSVESLRRDAPPRSRADVEDSLRDLSRRLGVERQFKARLARNLESPRANRRGAGASRPGPR
jgi:hypothetical protein